MKKDVSPRAALLPGKAVLIVITTTAVTAGFTLGYFVGKSVPPFSEPPILKHSASSDLVSAPAAPNSSSDLKNEASSSSQSLMQSSPSEGTQDSTPPSLHGKKPSAADVWNEGKIVPKSQRAAMIEKKATPGAGEQTTLPSGVSYPDTVTRNTFDPQSATRSRPAPSIDPSVRKIVYSVQAAAFKHQKDADALKQTLEGKGYEVSVKKEPTPKGAILFKVRVGEFEQKKDASVFALKLKKMDGLNAFAVVKD